MKVLITLLFLFIVLFYIVQSEATFDLQESTFESNFNTNEIRNEKVNKNRDLDDYDDTLSDLYDTES
eukprot:gene8575-400_t